MKYIFLFAFSLCTALAKAQTINNPGKVDSLYPVTNLYNELPFNYASTVNQTTVYGVAKEKEKYYMAGDFTNISDNAGSSLLFDTTNNLILNNRTLRINGKVTTAVPDGQGGFYIGGTFTKIGDSARNYLAQINSTGRATAWNPAPDNKVNIIIKRNDTLYIGGAFEYVKGVYRPRLIIFSLLTNNFCAVGLFPQFVSLNALVLQKDTLILAGEPYSGYSGLKKYNIKNGVAMPWGLTYAEYMNVNFMQLSPDDSIIVCAGNYNGDYIIGINNKTGALAYTINTYLNTASSINSGSLRGMKLSGNKCYAVGVFGLLYKTSNFYRNGFFAFNPLNGTILSENPIIEGFLSFLETKDNKIYLSGKFKSVNSIPRDQFAILDTGTLALSTRQLNPSDPLTALAFNGNTMLAAGHFKGVYTSQVAGFAAIDTFHQLSSFNPGIPQIEEGKRITFRGDSIFLLVKRTGYSSCLSFPETTFRIISRSTGSAYLTGNAPTNNMDDFILDGNYMYAAFNGAVRRFNLPQLTIDAGWGFDWSQSSFKHTANILLADANKIYAVGDTKYYTCASNQDPKRGYVDVYSKTGGLGFLNTWYFTGDNPTYDPIRFDHAVLTGNRLFIQGSFTRLNGQSRRNFSCVNINTGLLTNWQANFTSAVAGQSLFGISSDLKLYQGKIWFGSASHYLADGSLFYGFGGMDTLSGNLFQPVKISARDFQSEANMFPRVHDFILSAKELVLAGRFDSINGQPVKNFAVLPLNGIDSSSFCRGAGRSFTSNIVSGLYQWQQDAGAGFLNISDNSEFMGTNTSTLTLANPSGSLAGSKFRCLSGIQSSNIYLLNFYNNWTGAINSSWENSGNWSCGQVPDAFTSVIINNGIVVVNNSTSVFSLTIAPGVSFTVSSGVNFRMLH